METGLHNTDSFSITGQVPAGEVLSRSSFSVVCRGSWLSLAQAAIFRQKVQQVLPGVSIEVIVRETAGDKNQSTPLHLVEGKDFFTKDIQRSLRAGEADFALHSLKDVSSEDFFNGSCHAVISRDMLQDVAIFNAGITEKISNGTPLVLGTSSPRRSAMATAFLEQALPVINGRTAIIGAAAVRGNVDVRLQKLSDGEYDGLILAAAGLNRLLAFEPAAAAITKLLAEKKMMLLPLFECPPAAGQGAIAAETDPANQEAAAVLRAIEDARLTAATAQERKTAFRHGYGCSQQFGTFYLETDNTRFGYTSGKDEQGNTFTEWDYELQLEAGSKKIFSAADHMKDFFTYRNNNTLPAGKPAAFVSSHKAIHSDVLARHLQQRQVWAAGTRTWYALAKKGIWVQGCADGLGLHFLLQQLSAPLFATAATDIEILTNTSSALQWQEDGICATGTYEPLATGDAAIRKGLADADIIFWTSFLQYREYGQYSGSTAIHCCPAGKTAALLKAQGIAPVVFPTIKAFIQWKKSITP